MVENFFDAFNINSILREENNEDDALATMGRTFRPTPVLKLKHEVQLRYHPSIPDNIKYREVFEDDQQLKRFLELVEEFSATHIDQDGVYTTSKEETNEPSPTQGQDKVDDTSFENYIVG